MTTPINIDDLQEKVDDEIEKILSVGDDTFLIEAEEDERSDDLSEAKQILQEDVVKSKLCPALQGFSEDIWELSKITTKVIGTLIISGTITIAANVPFIIALAIIILFRMGVEIYCA